MNHSLPTITRKSIANGKAFKYENATTGEVVTGRSTRLYTHASVYQYTALTAWDVKCGRQVGDQVVFLHSRADIAAKGSSDGNRIPGWVRVPGIVEIQEA